MAWTLCSKEDVVSIHPVSISELQDSWSDMVEALIREHLGRPYLGTTQAITDEWHSGDGSNFLNVKYPPIVSVTSLTVDGADLVAADYVVSDSYVQLRYLTCLRDTLNVRISYVSGSAQVSDVVRLTTAAMIVAIVNYRKRAGADSSIKWSSAEQKVGGETPNLNVGLTSHLVQIMKRLLKRSRVRAR